LASVGKKGVVMSGNGRERMSSVDTAWLRMDRPSNLMMICGVLIFREHLSLARLKTTLTERFLRFERFRQHPVQTAAGAFWQNDDGFDISPHVQRAALRGHAGKAELEAFVSALIGTPLDPGRPLWQFHLVERFETGSAVVVRIHHCYADGIALIRVMLSLTDADRRGNAAGTMPPPRPRRAAADDPLAEWIAPLAGAVEFARQAGPRLVEKGIELWQDPGRAVTLAEQGATLTAEIVRLATMGEDSPTRFKGKPGIAKRVAWADPVPLSEVKAIGRAYDCSVNDVLLSSVAGAMRAYLLWHGDEPDGVTVRALVPVNLRPPDKEHKLGNRFGLVFLDLPLGIANPVERLYAVRANMQALKGSYQPVLALGILAAMGAGPKILQENLLALLARNATAVMTNVPGPQQPLFLAGASIASLMFWVPQSGDIGMGVSILSYDGAVQFGVVTDRALCPDPDHLIERFAPEFERLVLATMLSPWPWKTPPDPGVIERALVAAR
jgi:WS/DGAT/MGAT family acyltransferase